MRKFGAGVSINSILVGEGKSKKRISISRNLLRIMRINFIFEGWEAERRNLVNIANSVKDTGKTYRITLNDIRKTKG